MLGRKHDGCEGCSGNDGGMGGVFVIICYHIVVRVQFNQIVLYGKCQSV